MKINPSQYQSVSDVIMALKSSVESGFRNIQVLGEVTNLSRSASGHCYFSLIDQDSSLQCSFFKMDVLRSPEFKKIKNGDKIICFGSVSIYPKRGTLQLIVKRASPFGEGDLKAQLEILKERLSREGLFDIDSKLEIPKLSHRIGLITSEHGAAIQDFLSILKRRSLSSEVLLRPSLMQGEKAAASVIQSLQMLIRYHLKVKPIDVIVITRGGGSLEDLWCFNDEALAWEIYNCPVPIVSAIGHEIDYTICDLVSDKRMETPSAAAEFLSEYQLGTLDRLQNSKERLELHALKQKREVSELQKRIDPRYWVSLIRHRMSEVESRLLRLNLLSRPLELMGYYSLLQRLEESLQGLKSFPLSVERRGHKLQEIGSLLGAINPDNVLKRGYSYLKTKEQKVLSGLNDFKELPENETLEIVFHDGVGKVSKRND